MHHPATEPEDIGAARSPIICMVFADGFPGARTRRLPNRCFMENSRGFAAASISLRTEPDSNAADRTPRLLSATAVQVQLLVIGT